MPVALIIWLNEFGAMRIPSILATMVSSFVRFAISAGTQLAPALACFEEHAVELPLPALMVGALHGRRPPVDHRWQPLNVAARPSRRSTDTPP